MRINENFDDFDLSAWIRSIAILLDSEATDIRVEDARPSVVIYFDILDPSTTTQPDGVTYTGIRNLSGNEKMLVLFQWWLYRDSRISSLPFEIEDFRIYAVSSDNSEVVPLFEQSISVGHPYLPYNPYKSTILDKTTDGSTYHSTYKQTTLEFVINSSNMLYPSFLIIVVFVFIIL